MRHFIRISWLILLLVMASFMTACNIEPEDKWPEITYYEYETNLDIKVKQTPLGFQLQIPDAQVDMTVDLITYNINQEFTARIMLQRIRREYTVQAPGGVIWADTDDYPFDFFITTTDEPVDDPRGDPTEYYVVDGIFGEYVEGSGHPPQGKITLTFFFQPDWLPFLLTDWVRSDEATGAIEITNRYVYLFEVIIEDLEGRTDTFDFTVGSKLVLDSSDN